MKNVFAVLTLCLFVSASFAQTIRKQPQQLEKETIEQKAPRALVQKIMAQKEMKEAIDVMADSEVTINPNTAKLVKINKNDFAVIFDIDDPKNGYDLKNVVYLKQEGKAIVYFDTPNKAYQPANATARWGCKWTSWTYTGSTYCYNNWWCGRRHDRRATYQYQVKKKVCPGGKVKKVKYRLRKRHCGC